MALSAHYPSKSWLKPSEAERIRRELISHETSIKSLGLLYLIGATLFGLICLVLTVVVVAGKDDSPYALPIYIFLIAILAPLGSIALQDGRGLRALDVNIHRAACLFAGLGLLVVPIGTLIGGYTLFLLLSEKGARVFSPEYQDLILATPHVTHKSPWLAGSLIVAVAALVDIYIYFR